MAVLVSRETRKNPRKLVERAFLWRSILESRALRSARWSSLSRGLTAGSQEIIIQFLSCRANALHLLVTLCPSSREISLWAPHDSLVTGAQTREITAAASRRLQLKTQRDACKCWACNLLVIRSARIQMAPKKKMSRHGGAIRILS